MKLFYIYLFFRQRNVVYFSSRIIKIIKKRNVNVNVWVCAKINASLVTKWKDQNCVKWAAKCRVLWAYYLFFFKISLSIKLNYFSQQNMKITNSIEKFDCLACKRGKKDKLSARIVFLWNILDLKKRQPSIRIHLIKCIICDHDTNLYYTFLYKKWWSV